MTVPAVALWRQGQEYLTVSSPLAGEWAYDVEPGGDRPLHEFLHGTPWCVYPGAEWEEQPGGRDGNGLLMHPVWTVPVFPESAEAARKLGVKWPPES